MRTHATITALLLAVLLGLGGLAPAFAAGGPPTVTSLAPAPVDPDGVLTVVGAGCDPGSPVSFELFDTSGGAPALTLHGTTSGVVADGSGGFDHGIALGSHFAAGNEIGVASSCTSTFDWAQASNPVADNSYVLIALSAGSVQVSVASRVGFGSRPKVLVTTTDAPGQLTVTVDGAQVYASSTGGAPVTFRLSRSLSIGTHSVGADYDPAVATASSATDTATVRVVKAGARITLTRATAGAARVGRLVKLKVAIASTGPRTGTVKIKDGARTLRTRVLRAGDDGRKVIQVRMRDAGVRTLTARFVGNSKTKPCTSPRLRVTVSR